jgi:hypothetical protein
MGRPLRELAFFVGYDPAYFSSDLLVESFAPSSTVNLITVERALKGLPLTIDCEWQSADEGWRPVGNLDLDDHFMSWLAALFLLMLAIQLQLNGIFQGVRCPGAWERDTLRKYWLDLRLLKLERAIRSQKQYD